MKNSIKTIIAILFLSIFVVACGSTETQPASNTASDPQSVDTVDNTPTKIVKEETKELPQSIPADIQARIDKFNKLKSYSFYYTDMNNAQKTDRYTVKGDKIRIDLKKQNRYTIEDQITVVYLDFEEGTAEGYCESESKYDCDDPNKQRTIRFEDYIITLPEAWLKRITPDAEIIGSEQFDNRKGIKVSFVEGISTFNILMDTYYGIPLKVWEFQDDELVMYYAYEEMASNTVKDDEMVHQEIKVT